MLFRSEGEVKEPCEYSDNKFISAVAEIEYNIYNEWVRFSVPFDTIEANIENIENNVKYILASFTTNKTAGGNTGKTDNVYIDDISLIYKPTLAVNEMEKTSYTQGDELDIPYELNGSLSM